MLSGLPSRRCSPIAFAVSVVAHAAFTIALFQMVFPEAMPVEPARVVPVYVPAPRVRRTIVAPTVRRKLVLAPQKVAAVWLEPVAPLVAVAAPVRIAVPEAAPRIEPPSPPPPAPVSIPEIAPRAPVKVGAFSLPAAAEKSAPAADPAPRMAGFSTLAAKPDPHAARTAVATAGFGAAETAVRTEPIERAVKHAEFGDAEARVASASRPAPREARSLGLEILDKPRPLYSEEARRLRLEGVVLLEMSFSAAGQARVLRVVRGLGHGLDENAAIAASGIRFRPAFDHGRPVDTVASVRIEFQLAY